MIMRRFVRWFLDWGAVQSTSAGARTSPIAS